MAEVFCQHGLGLEDYDSLFIFYDSKQNADIFSSLAPTFALQSSNVPVQVGKTLVAKTDNPNFFILARLRGQSLT